MDRIFNVIRLITLWLGGAAILLMAVQVTTDVILRKISGVGMPATSEIVSRYWMVTASFLPIAFAEMSQRNIAVTVLVDAAPRWTAGIAGAVSHLCTLGVFLLLTYQTTIEALSRTARGTFVEVGTLNLSIWQSYWILPVSFGLVVLVLLVTPLRAAADRAGQDSDMQGGPNID